MASTYDPILGIELQADGENDTTWGQKANNALSQLGEAVGGYLAKSVAGGSNVTLTQTDGTSDEVRQFALKLTGAITADINVVVPDREGRWLVWNATSGNYSITFKTSSGTGVIIPQGYSMLVFSDGTNVEPGGVAMNMSSTTYKPVLQGTHVVALPATGLIISGSDNPEAYNQDTTTNAVARVGYNFDKDSDETLQLWWFPPDSWDEGTVQVQFIWTAITAGTGNVVWSVEGVSVGDGDDIDAAFGTAQTVTDAYQSTNYLHSSSYTSAMTIAGTPAEGDAVVFRVSRDADNGSDTFTQDALLLGIRIKIGIDEPNDA